MKKKGTAVGRRGSVFGGGRGEREGSGREDNIGGGEAQGGQPIAHGVFPLC